MTIFKDNAEQVVSDKIDDEFVILNLTVGHYFSLSGCATELWAAILQGINLSDLNDALIQAFPKESPATLQHDLQDWIKQLLQEKLIIEIEGSSQGHPQLNAPYLPPKLEKYNDLQDLLLIDPIHDVDDSGWPALPQHLESK